MKNFLFMSLFLLTACTLKPSPAQPEAPADDCEQDVQVEQPVNNEAVS